MAQTILAAALLGACLSAPARAQTCIALWYGSRHHGRLTASGERSNQHAMTAAHRTRPFGSLPVITRLGNGRRVTIRITDREPFVRGRCLDRSRTAARAIGIGVLAQVSMR